MRAQNPDSGLASDADQLCWEVDEGSPKALPFPARHLLGQIELGDPLAEIPREAGDLQPGRVATHLGHGHAPGCNTRAEPGDQVLLITALVGPVENLLGRPALGQIW